MEKITGFLINIDIFLKKQFFCVYILTLILFRLPPLYIFPIKSSLLTTTSIASFLLLVLFFRSIANLNLKKKEKKQIIPIGIYFFSVSLSILGANNIASFLSSYKNLFLGIIFFFVTLLITKRKTLPTIITLIFTTIVNVFYGFIIYFKISPFNIGLNQILYDKFVDYVNLQSNSGKFFGEFFDFSLLSLVLYLFFQTKNKFFKVILILLISALIFLSFISNYRTIILVLFFGIFASLLLIYNQKKVKKFFFLILFISFLIYMISGFVANNNGLRRFLLSDPENFETVISRLYLWKQSIIIGLSSPVLGVGLGNFYEYLPSVDKYSSPIVVSLNRWRQNTLTQSHNVFFSTFVESGFLGLFGLFYLLTTFIKTDIEILKKEKNNTQKNLIISFWSLFIYSLFNPVYVIQYTTLFWLIRGLILISK